MLFKRRIRRSWIDFGLNIVRGPRPPHLIPTGVVRLYIGILAVPLLVPPLPPPLLPLPTFPSFPHSLSLGVTPRYQVLMYSHDVSRHVLSRVLCGCPVRNILT
jgi:hypothetical protein